MTRHLKRLAATAAVIALSATPALSATTTAAPQAAPLSVAKAARAGTPTARGNRIAAGPTATLVNIGILAALVAGVLVATSSGDDSDSN